MSHHITKAEDTAQQCIIVLQSRIMDGALTDDETRAFNRAISWLTNVTTPLTQAEKDEIKEEQLLDLLVDGEKVEDWAEQNMTAADWRDFMKGDEDDDT